MGSIPGRASDVGGPRINTEGLFSPALGLSLGNHRTLDDTDHASEVVKTAQDHDALIPACYLNKQQAQGMTSGH